MTTPQELNSKRWTANVKPKVCVCIMCCKYRGPAERCPTCGARTIGEKD